MRPSRINVQFSFLRSIGPLSGGIVTELRL